MDGIGSGGSALRRGEKKKGVKETLTPLKVYHPFRVIQEKNYFFFLETFLAAFFVTFFAAFFVAFFLAAI